MAEQRPQGSLTVVLLPSGLHGQDCLMVARSWASEGLLRRALWIPSENVQPSQFGGAEATGFLLDQGQEAALDVLTVLSRSRLRTLTLLILQICDTEETVDTVQLGASELLVPALRNARPEALVPAAAANPVEVLLVNLLTGPTGLAGVPFERVTSRWYDANLVASPEDRRAADQMDRFVRPADNLVSWAMAQCATVGGLWSGMPQGPWEIMRRGTEDSSLSQGDFVRPVRGFARIVTSAPTARRALATAMAELRFVSENALMADHLLPVGDPQPYLDRVVAAFDEVDGGRIRYSTPSPAPAPGRQRMGFFGALGEFIGFSAREIGKVPTYVFRRTKARVGARTTATLSGEDGHMVVYAGGESPDLDVYMADFERQSLEAQRSLTEMAGGVPPAAPELWRTLRATTFGLLDGSPIPEPIPTPIVADQRVVLPSTMLVVPPPLPWAPSADDLHAITSQAGADDLFVPSVSPWRAEWLRDLISEAQQHESSQLDELQAQRNEATATQKAYEDHVAHQLATSAAAESPELVNEADRKADPEVAEQEEVSGSEDEAETGDDADSTTHDGETDPQLGEQDPQSDTDSELDVGATPTAEESTPGAQAWDEGGPAPVTPSKVDIAALDAELDRVRRQADALHREHASLDRWMADRESSLLWRLASKLQSRTLQASADAAQFRDLATGIPEIDSEELRRARNKFANRFLLMFSIGVLLALLTWRFGDQLMELISLPGWVAWVIWAIIVVVWLMIILISHFRRRSRFLAQLRLLRHQQRDAVRQWREARYAEQKLQGLYEQLVDWGEILGYAVHDPWQPKESWFSGLPDADLAANLPTCVDLAVPDPNDVRGFRRLKREAMRSLAGEGWRARAFNVLLERMLADQDQENSSAVAAQLDLDSPATPNGSRHTMLELLRSDELQATAAEQVIRSKAAGLYADHTTLARHALVPINSEYAAEDTDLLDAGSELELIRPEWGEFLGGVLDGKTQFSVNLWSDEGATETANRQRMHTLAFAPPRMATELADTDATLVPARAADVNRGVELSARCDFGPTVERKQVRLFAESSQQLSEFEGAAERSYGGRGGPYSVVGAPQGSSRVDGTAARRADSDRDIFN